MFVVGGIWYLVSVVAVVGLGSGVGAAAVGVIIAGALLVSVAI